MAHYIIRKVVHVIVVLMFVSFGVAFILELTPGDAAYAIVGDTATPDQIATVREELGLNDPLHERYWSWLTGVMQGDFGASHLSNRPVTDLIAQRLPVTAQLAAFALLIALAVSIPVGVLTAHRAGSRVDRFSSLATSTMVSFPVFVTAQVLVYIFALQLGLFPATGWRPLGDGLADNLRYLFLPAVTLATIEIPAYTRLLRADMIQTLQEDYILAARAKGLPTRRILLRHALRPSSFSLLTLAGLSLGRLLSAAIVVEVVYGLPGLGQLIVQDIQRRDVMVVQGAIMFIAIVYVVANTLTDIAYRFLDPRVRLQRADR